MQTTKEVNPQPRIAPCINMWSVTFLFLFFFFCLWHLLNVGACVHHIAREGQEEWTTLAQVTGDQFQISLRSPQCYSIMSCATLISIVSCIHVNTKKLHNITCILVAKGVILWSLECTLICAIRFFFANRLPLYTCKLLHVKTRSQKLVSLLNDLCSKCNKRFIISFCYYDSKCSKLCGMLMY